MSKILITGATGQLGTATIEKLLTLVKAENIVALARDAQKASALKEKGVEIRIGSYDDLASLEKAVEGVDKVLLISGLEQNRLQQHKNVIDAAKKAGVKHILYTGVALKDPASSVIKAFMNDHFGTEDYIKESGLNYTFLRNTLYTEAIPGFAGEQAVETGIHLPTGNSRVPYAYRKDLAEATAIVLGQDGHENKTYQLTGGALYTYGDVAGILKELSGKEVTYTDVDAAAFRDTLKQLGVPEVGILIATGFTADIKNGQYDIASDDLEQLLGRKPTDIRPVLKELYSL